MNLPVVRVLATLTAASCAWIAVAQDAPNRVASKELERLKRNRKTIVQGELTKQGDDVLLQMKDASVQVANPQFIAAQIRQLPVTVSLAPDASGRPAIEAVRLRATKTWTDQPAGVQSRYQAVTDAQKHLDATAQRALAASATRMDLEHLATAVGVTKRSIVEAYKRLPAEARKDQRVLVEQHRELQAASKALYGVNRDDRYPPTTYSKIFETSRATFALAVIGEAAPRCSGVLIGSSLALTNDHCLLENIPSELEARFDYENDLSGNSFPQRVFPVAEFVVENIEARGKLDFVLLRLGHDASGKAPGDYYKAPCVTTKTPARDDALYLVGHPLGGPRTVHDNAFVYFPFRVNPEAFIELEILVRSEFDSLDAEDLSYKEGKLKEFRESYKQIVVDNVVKEYDYISARFGDQPTIGADCDTYRGNSGSPAYDRHSHNLIGLLFDGQEDLGQSWKPGWRAHEAILPMSEILGRLETAAPGWSGPGSGVCIVP
jgi:V8-like Glu-specific endopeptidase